MTIQDQDAPTPRATIAHKVAWNTLAQLVGRFLTIVLGLLLLKIITNKLGVERSGEYLLSLTYAQLFTTVADLGLNAYLTRDINKPTGKTASDLFKGVMAIRLSSGVIFIVIALLLVLLLPYTPELRIVIALALISGFMMLINSTLVAVYQGFLRMEIPVLSDLICKVLTVSGVLWVTLTFQSLPLIMGVIISTALINLIINLIVLTQVLKIEPVLKKEQWRVTLKSTLPIWITSILVLVYFKVDSLLLSILPLPNGLSNLVEVGYYGTAYKYLEIFITFPVIFLGTMLPVMSASALVDRQKFNYYLQTSLDFLSAVALPVLVGTFILATPLIKLVSSSEFLPAVPALKILIFAFLFSALGGIFSYAVLSLDNQRKLILPYIFATIFNIVVNFFAIRYYSFIGAAYTTVATEIIVAVSAYMIVSRQMSFQPKFIIFAKSLLASLVMGGLLYLMKEFNIFICASAGIVVYLLILYLVKGVDPKMIELIKLKKPQSVTN